jgi:aldose 1-epimerase
VTQLRLHNSDLDLTISPQNGGGIVSFDAFGEQILVPVPDPIRVSTDPAAFVLVPYCNRIAHGKATFEGQSIELAPNLEGEIHPLHGEGWLSEWKVVASDDRAADLSLSYRPRPGRWPWAFDATQRYELTPGGLRHVLSVRNMSEQPMPAGLGFHPYFLREPGISFEAEVGGIWRAGKDQLPTLQAALPQGGPWPAGQFEPDLDLDHCFTGWERKLQIVRKNVRITLIASAELGLLHVYAPVGGTFFCAEPVSHMPDALNQPDGGSQMRVLEPGEVFEAEISYLIEKST